MSGGRLTINIISSDRPGETLESEPRYRRTLEVMQILRALLDGQAVSHAGEHYRLEVAAPRIRTVSGCCPPFYFGGLSEAAKQVAAQNQPVGAQPGRAAGGGESGAQQVGPRTLTLHP